MDIHTCINILSKSNRAAEPEEFLSVSATFFKNVANLFYMYCNCYNEKKMVCLWHNCAQQISGALKASYRPTRPAVFPEFQYFLLRICPHNKTKSICNVSSSISIYPGFALIVYYPFYFALIFLILFEFRFRKLFCSALYSALFSLSNTKKI